MNINKKLKILSLGLIFAGSTIGFSKANGLESLLGGVSGNAKYKNIKDAAKQGLNQSIAGNVKRVSDTILGVIPDTFKTSWLALNIYVNKFVFGTKPLDSRNLELMKEHINKTLAPFLNKAYFRDLLCNDQESFIEKKEDVIFKLEHIKANFIKALLVYNNDQYRIYNPSVLNVKAKFVALCNTFSLLDNDEISHHITNNINYLSKIIYIFKKTTCPEDIEHESNNIQYWTLNIQECFSQLDSLLNLNSSSNKVQISPELLKLFKK